MGGGGTGGVMGMTSVPILPDGGHRVTMAPTVYLTEDFSHTVLTVLLVRTLSLEVA